MELLISDTLSIPEAELEYSFARSGGPGGQNVNKVSSKVILRWNLNTASTLSEAQRWQIQQRLASRITHEGILHLSCQTSRSQRLNRGAVTELFVALLQTALEIPPERIPTRPGRGARQRRLNAKKSRGQLKRLRITPDWEDV
jgi:ribosome-associated protein